MKNPENETAKSSTHSFVVGFSLGGSLRFAVRAERRSGRIRTDQQDIQKVGPQVWLLGLVSAFPYLWISSTRLRRSNPWF